MFFSLILIQDFQARAADPFTPNNTPSCNSAVNKGAQQSLNRFIIELQEKEYKIDIERAKQQAPTGLAAKVSDFFENIRYQRFQDSVLNKEVELRIFALKKYKCDLLLINPVN